MNLSWQSLLTQGESYRRYGDTKERQQKWLLACLERNKKTVYGRLFNMAFPAFIFLCKM